MIILAAVVALITAIVVISKKMSLQNRMKEAAEATEAAKKAAEEAKEVYDSMLSDQSKYDELQKTLEELTYGTREWKKALVEVNNQVLELLQTYPMLAKYLTRGEDGQLAVKDEGWDALIK
jgi:Sec-independent protein translocase protein TatA